jgi:polyisoprenoid-binding protein YceI
MRNKTSRLVRLAALSLLIAVPAATAAGASSEPAWATSATTVAVSGTSSLHDWTVRATTAKGSLVLPAGFLAGTANGAPSGSFSLAVKDLQSEHDRMNRLMWEALGAAAHPRIDFELRQATVQSGAGTAEVTVAVDGVLTVNGVSKPVRVPFRVRRDGERLIAKGELPVRMTDFGVKPPTAMMGTIKTGDPVRIELEATFTPTP